MAEERIDNAPAPAGPEAETDGGTGDAGADWRAAIADPEVRRSAEKFTDPAALAKSYRELERKLGGAVTPPGPEASDEERAAFDRRMGVPDEPAGYELRLPELPEEAAPLAERVYGPETLDWARGLFKAAGVRPDQAQALFEAVVARDMEQVAAVQAERGRAAQAAEAAMRHDWGGAYDDNLALAKRAAGRLFGAEVGELALADGGLLGNDPRFLKGLAAVGRMLGEDGFLGTQAGEDGRKSVEARLEELHAKGLDALTAAEREEKAALYETLYGGQPARRAFGSG